MLKCELEITIADNFTGKNEIFTIYLVNKSFFFVFSPIIIFFY